MQKWLSCSMFHSDPPTVAHAVLNAPQQPRLEEECTKYLNAEEDCKGTQKKWDVV